MNASSKVPAHFNGLNVLDYLSTRFNYLPEAIWQQMLDDGKILCQGVSCEGSRIVAKGEIIECELPEFEAPVVNFAYTIVYEDQWFLGINKPAGLRVHSGGKFVHANLIYHLRYLHTPPYPEVNLVNRIDADTSGLVLLARDKTLLSPMMQQFAEGLVDKRYLAVVAGRPEVEAGTINLPIGPVKGAKIPRYGVDHEKGKSAVTHYRIVREVGSHHTLLELHPETGRTHQLRVHLAAIGHPIAGDALYTMNDNDYLDYRCNPPLVSATLPRQALHSHQLRFFHPLLQSTCTLTAPLATDIEEFIQHHNHLV